MSARDGVAALERRLAARIFTLTAVDLQAGLARRVWTNQAAAYPVTGTKPVHRDGWFETCIVARQVFVANRPECYSAYFPDSDLIASLGCGSVVNLPVVDGGEVRGTVNLLDPAGSFPPDRVAEIVAAVQAARPDVLAVLAGA
jgi:hypothetical protein